MNRVLRVAVIGLALGWALDGQATEVLRWDRLPLSIPLVVGQERVIFVDRSVRVGLPAELERVLRVQSTDGAVYLLAHDEVTPSRVQLQDIETGELILLDVSAAPATNTVGGSTPLEPIKIVSALAGATEQDVPAHSVATPIPVVLTRYAAQNLYAPLRTVEALPGVRRAKLPADLPLHGLLPNQLIDVRPLAAWKLGHHWVSALHLRNQSTAWIALDPRELQGDFVAATFQHANLGPRGRATDTTVLYLVTQGRELSKALLPSLSPIDAGLNLPGSSAGEEVHDEE
ncbi:TIGR03749 family integrating conjugative element protein [Pseudomonas fluorescens]|uniref:TIGR03749 family integrating conjugative element protein n=1 Tax=Pseudomonas fluorescens TaxID=294 RepID=UPI001BE6E5B3|nr:TIGR03749 family integrating conjugative element protein [Pseudomonas fluorescens]MBT2375331.1 TIGR03749 family integrating conjugative element protein [Pseudomonas fluorescens]